MKLSATFHPALYSLLLQPMQTQRIEPIKFIDLFAGIGGIRIPFEELGYRCVFSSEWDPKAQRTYAHNFGVTPCGDIAKIEAKDIPPHDLLLAGFPCQPFSIMGKMQGFDDTRGTLFFDIARILQHHRPPYILLENVKQLTTHDKGKTFARILRILTELGYHCRYAILNALHFGLPQKRERLILVGFRDAMQCQQFSLNFPATPYDLQTIIDPAADKDPSLYASPRIRQKRLEDTKTKLRFYPSVWHENKSGNISILDHSCALRTGASYNYLLLNGQRRFSARELLRLQGFPEWFSIDGSLSDTRRLTGNSVPVPMIRAVAQRLNELIQMQSRDIAGC
jgi:modification methylase haeII